MDLPTQTHLTTLRDLLQYRLRDLRAEVHAAEMAHREPTAAAAHEVVDRKEDAARQQFQDVDDAQEQRDVGEMAGVEAALQRLDAGTYGDCVDCSEPIPLQRLLVQPAVLRCTACQAAHEQRASGLAR
jgi:DnaK suppressor protein